MFSTHRPSANGSAPQLLQLKSNDDGVIENAKFKAFGCGSALALSSLVPEWVKGKNIEDAGKIKNSDIRGRGVCVSGGV